MSAAAPGSLATPEARDVPSIVVRAPNWLGDLVMATPGFRALRAQHPKAHIAVLVRPALAPVLAGAPWFDEILPLASYRAGVRALWREARRVRAVRRFDLGVCIPDSFSSALWMRAAGVRRIVGYRRGGRTPLLHQAVEPLPEWGRRRLVARERFVLRLVEAVGASGADVSLELHCTPEEERRTDALRTHHGIEHGASTVLLAPGASFGPSKCWPVESFAAAGDRLAGMGHRVLVVGAPEEQDRVWAVARAMRAPAVALAGPELDLGVLKVLVRGASALLCNDAGARHIAVAFGVPCAVVMGPTALEKTNLNLERVAILEAEGVDCRPCYLRECPIDHRCMTRVEPERAVSALARLGLPRGAA